jgi:deoxyadenosine/deoxycytidine kinase
MIRVSIEGNNCSGKTYYLQLLERDHYNVHYEHYDPELTQKYYSDTKRYSLAYHLHMLKCFQQPKNIIPKTVQIYENSPYTLKAVHCGLLSEKNCFDVDEYRIYNNYYQTLGWIPDIMIYLFCHPLTCHHRCSKPNLEYITELHTKYEIVCDELNCQTKIYKVNAHEDKETVYRNIKEIIDNIDNIDNIDINLH